MKKFLTSLSQYLKKSDTLLLSLCLIASVYGVLLISSATRYSTTLSRCVYVQLAAIFLGVVLYVLFSVIDIDIFADRWKLLLIFGLVFIASLFVFGVEDAGNRAWIRFGDSLGIQPAEIVKIFFIIITAKVMVILSDGRGLSHITSVMKLVALFGAFFVLIIVASSDLGSALVYLFIFTVMLFAGGLAWYWFLIAFAGIAAISPLVWTHFFSQTQRDRILAPYNPSIDPDGLGITWQTNRSKMALASGRITGLGYGHGIQTQEGGIPKQHTDFIFSVSGEELGIIGCLLIFALLLLIIIRCVYVGIKSQNQLGALVCIGVASMLVFQMFENIGMCIGIAPVIGVTLPFFSYGGSSIVTSFAAMGLVSGVKMKPKPTMFLRW